MASSGLPKWLGEGDTVPDDPERPPWTQVPGWQKAVLLLGAALIGLLALALGVAILGGLLRVFRWVAWGVGCG